MKSWSCNSLFKMSDGKENTEALDKRSEAREDQDINISQKPKCSVKFVPFLVDMISKEAYTLLKKNKLAFVFYVTVIFFTIFNFYLSNVSDKKPCDITLCFQRNENLPAEINSFLNSINELNRTLQKLQEDMQFFGKKVKNSETEIKMLQNLLNSLERKFDKNLVEIKKEQENSYYVEVLLLLLIGLIVSYIIWKFNNSKRKTEENATVTGELSNVSSVLYLSEMSQESRIRSLTKSFLGNREFSPVLIAKEEDILEINSKIVFLFVDFNDRNIILEGPNETSPWKRRIIEKIEKRGGKVVVIYQFHPDSRNLEDECLYSQKLTSIKHHPVLRRLSKEGCMLSIYNEFSEFQKSHLDKLCKNILP